MSNLSCPGKQTVVTLINWAPTDQVCIQCLLLPNLPFWRILPAIPVYSTLPFENKCRSAAFVNVDWKCWINCVWWIFVFHICSMVAKHPTVTYFFNLCFLPHRLVSSLPPVAAPISVVHAPPALQGVMLSPRLPPSPLGPSYLPQRFLLPGTNNVSIYTSYLIPLISFHFCNQMSWALHLKIEIIKYHVHVYRHS